METNSETVLSVLKKAEKEDAFVLRFFNPTQAEAKASFTVNPSSNQVHEGNLNEKVIAPITLEKNQFTILVKPNQAKVRYEREKGKN